VSKKYRRLLCGLLLPALLCLPVRAAGPIRLKLSGTRLGGQTYGSAVSLEISGAGPEERLLIKENGRWMSLSPGPDGVCQLNFTADGDYRLRFCSETADGQRSGFADTHFTIDQPLAAFIAGCRRMPDPDTASDTEIESRAVELLELQRQGNTLDGAQRALIPDELGQALAVCISRLERLQPQTDVTSPLPPTLRILGESAALESTVYRSEVRLEITPPSSDFARLLMRSEGEWTPLEPVDGVYQVDCSGEGEYGYDFCSEDLAGNRSMVCRAEFIISPALFDFYEAVGKGTGLGVEEALKVYQLMDARACSMVDEALVKQLGYDYERACAQAGHTPTAYLDGKKLHVLGMLSGFYGGKGVQLEARGEAVAESRTVSGKTLLWTYELTFTGAEGGAAEPKEELLVSVELPPALLKKKQVTVLDAGGRPLETHVRNEDQGFVLTFPVQTGGVYSVGADAG
jgi:hypothetical protein